MSWSDVALGDVLRVKHGYAFKGEYFGSEGPFVVLTPGSFNEFGGFREQRESTKYYVGDVPDGFILEEGELLIAMTEQASGLLGSSMLVPAGKTYLHNQRLGRIEIVDEHRLLRRYAYYLFNTADVRAQISASATGGKVRHTAPSRIARVKIALPRVATQQRIVEILSSYDTLIENNRRRMALVENTARQLYREWFVLLRFPGREHTRVSGGVPERWERRTLADCATFSSGGTPSKAREDFWEGDIPWVSSGELTEMRIADTPLHITREAAEAGSRLVPRETILAVVRGMSLAKEWRIGLVSREVAFNQDLKAITANAGIDPLFLFHALDAQRDQVRDRAGEAAHGTKKIETAVLSSLPILVPPRPMQRLFRDHVAPMHDLWDNLSRQNKKLREARDLLLPRLMSGEIAV